MNDKRPFITVIIPAYNEAGYIGRCLESVAANDYPKDSLEVFVVDGMSSDGTREIVAGFAEKHPFISLIDNPDRYVPHALNRGIEKARGEYIIRLDAHSEFPDNYFSKLIEWHGKLDADNVGAVCRTGVVRETPVSLANRVVLSDRLGVGNSFFRTGTDKVREVDTVPFGCYRRAVFDRIGLFDTRLVRNQDIELNKRLAKNGGKIYLIPDLECTYYAKESYRALARSSYNNGLWNVLTAKYTGSLSSLSLRHFVPLLFLLSLIVPLPFALLSSYALIIPAVSAAAYLLVIGVRSAARVPKGSHWPAVVWAFMVLHLSYGFGSLTGLVKSVK